MRADGQDEKTIDAVMKFREMTDRAFDLMAGDLRRVKVDSKSTAQVIISLMVGSNRTRVLTPYAFPTLYDEVLEFISRSIKA